MEEMWKKRLLQAIDDDGRSDRAISLAANLGENFVNQFRNSDKAPGVDKLLRVINALNVSVIYIFTGAPLGRVDEDLVLLLSSVPEGAKVALLQALRAKKPESP